MGFVASLWDFISGYAIAPSQSPDEESLPFSAVRRRSLRCYNRSKFGLLQQERKHPNPARVVITVQNSVFYNGRKFDGFTSDVVITVQNSVFYNDKLFPVLCFRVVITVQNSVFYNWAGGFVIFSLVVITVQNSVFYNTRFGAIQTLKLL